MEVTREQNTQIFRKTNISYPLIGTHMCAYQGVRNVRFSENLAQFVFLLPPFWDSPFCFINDYLLIQINDSNWKPLQTKNGRQNDEYSNKKLLQNVFVLKLSRKDNSV